MKKKSRNVWTIVTTLLGILLFVNILSFCVRLAKGEDYYPYGEESMIYSIRDEDYVGAVGKIKHNETIPGYNGKWMEEYRAVADYFEALSKQKAWETYGNLEEAKKWATEAEKNSTRMGEYSFARQKIDEKLEIE